MEIDAPVALAEEGNHFSDRRLGPEFLFEAVEGGRQRQALAKEDAIRLLDVLDVLSAHAAPTHTRYVDPDHGVHRALADKWRNILGRDGAGAQHLGRDGAGAQQSESADVDELVHRAVVRQRDVVADHAVAAYKGSVAQSAPVTDDTIMAHMTLRQEKIMTADARGSGLARAAVDRDVFAKRVVIANF
jgi:hypothetical protein